ncbi:MAG: MscL family protein [Thermoplasmatales archaeon]
MTANQSPTNNVENRDEILEELKKIRTLLEPKPAPPAPLPPKGFVKEFKSFLEQYKVMGMAVAFILGLYLGTLVQSLVTNIIMPIIDLVIPGIAWQNIHAGPFLIGSFLGALVTFIIIAFVIFLLVKLTTRLGIK